MNGEEENLGGIDTGFPHEELLSAVEVAVTNRGPLPAIDYEALQVVLGKITQTLKEYPADPEYLSKLESDLMDQFPGNAKAEHWIHETLRGVKI